MNKLEKISGKKIPFVWDDFDFTQEAVREAFYGLLSAFGVSEGDSFRISGCQVTVSNGTYSVTDGYIAFKGEICKVMAHSVTPGNNSAYWGIVETYQPNGYKEDSEGVSHDTYLIRQAKLVTGALPPDALIPECDYLRDKLVAIVSADLAAKNDPFSWINPTYTNDWEGSSLPATGIYVRYRKDQFGYLEIRGNAIPTNATGEAVFTLPAGYRPSEEQYRINSIVNDRDGNIKPLEIDESGQVRVINFDSTASAYQFNLRVKLW